MVESDSLVAVEAINNKVELFGNCRQLVHSIKQLITGWDVSIVYCGRESNSYADWLAKKAAESNVNFTILHSAPMNMVHLVQRDASYSSASVINPF